jgi:hypothetical protein
LGAFLGEPMMDKAALAHWREVIKDTVLRAVRSSSPVAGEVAALAVNEASQNSEA